MFVAFLAVIRALTTWSEEVALQLAIWGDRITGYFFHRSAIASLHQLDDRALQDIGLARSQIEAAVYGLVILRNRGRM